MKKMRKVLSLLMVMAMILCCMTACSKSNSTDDKGGSGKPEAGGTVVLTLWGAEDDQEMLKEMVEEFKAANPGTTFEISIGTESESTCKDTVLKDIEAAADVFAFADDQLNELVNAGALQAVTVNKDAIIEANGGASAGAVSAATLNGELYAYPMTADNGYFMFYNKEYFTEEDVKTLDKMLDVAAAAGKKMTMELDNAWYLYSFFQGAGLELTLNEDGTNTCNWNTGKGVDVVESLLNITSHEGFVNLTDAEFATGVADGSIIAGVNGVWNAATAEAAWGDNYAAVKLPTYTLAGEQVQMASYAGYKLVGVNAYSENVGWAMALAEWLTNYDNQVKRFEMRGLGPSNVLAASSQSVQSAPAIAALAAQSQYARVQRVGQNYWDAAKSFGAIMKEGNTAGTPAQELLDNMVAGITAPIE